MCLFSSNQKSGPQFTPGTKPIRDTDTTLTVGRVVRKDTDKPTVAYGTEGKKSIEGGGRERNPASSLAISVPKAPAANTSGVNVV